MKPADFIKEMDFVNMGTIVNTHTKEIRKQKGIKGHIEERKEKKQKMITQEGKWC